MISLSAATTSLRLAARGTARSDFAAATSLARTSPALRGALTTSARRLNLNPDARKRIDDAVKAHPLVVFMKGTPEMPMCGFSRAVVQIMEVQGVKAEKMKTYNVLDSSELREQIKLYSSWPTIPQVFIKGDFVGGCDLVLNMHQTGELEQMLVDAGAVDASAAAKPDATESSSSA